MKTIFTVLMDFEKLIYKILMWIILIPKTNGDLAVIYREDHFPGGATNLIQKIDNNTVTDHFLYTFPDLESGEYYVNVYAGKYYPFRKDTPVVELYNSYLKVTVPVKLDEQ